MRRISFDYHSGIEVTMGR